MVPADEAASTADDEQHENRKSLLDGEDELSVGDDPTNIRRAQHPLLECYPARDIRVVDVRILIVGAGLPYLELNGDELVDPMGFSVGGRDVLTPERSVDFLPVRITVQAVRSRLARAHLQSRCEAVLVDDTDLVILSQDWGQNSR